MNTIPKIFYYIIVLIIITIGACLLIFEASEMNFKVCILIVGLTGIVIYLTKIAFTKKAKISIEPAFKFIQEVYDTHIEYCLILRPFGNDGNITYKGSFREIIGEGIINAFRTTELTVEQAIELAAKQVFEIQTTALVNPEINIIIPSSPKFIAADNHNWKAIVSKLLKRALIVVFYIPPSKTMTNSLLWEIKAALKYGLWDRSIFILPPPTDDAYMQIVNFLENELKFSYSEFNAIPNNTILFSPIELDEFDYWCMDEDDKNKIINAVTYKNALVEAMNNIKYRISDFSFLEKYLYKDT